MLRAELLSLVTTTATKVTVAVAVIGLVVTQLMFVTLLPDSSCSPTPSVACRCA